MAEYINREALLEHFQFRIPVTCEISKAYKDCVDLGRQLIIESPAADVVEVRYGRWVLTKTEHGWNGAEYPAEYTCSVCGRTEPQQEPYCNCGAKMDGKGENNA